MALGFKIADGYVEVHADYDRGELRRAAQAAADDFGDEFGRESSQEATKSFNKDFRKNFADNFDKNRQTTTIVAQKMVHNLIAEMEEETRRQKADFDKAGRTFAQRFGDSIRKGLDRANFVAPLVRRMERNFAQGGDSAGVSFVKRFIETVTFGMADLPRAAPRGGFATSAAKLGTALGALAAGAMIIELGNTVTALLPLALGGALLAVPIADLIARNVDLEKGKLSFKKNDVGAALKGFIRQAQQLADAMGKVFKGPFIAGLKQATALFKELEGPLTRAVKAITPGAMAMWNGLLGAFKSFGVAFGPALKGVNAGLKQWGVELPKIGAALGKAFSIMLSNPALVRKAVQGLSTAIQFLVTVLARIVNALTWAGAAIDSFARAWRFWKAEFNSAAVAVPAYWQRLVEAFGPLKKALQDVWTAFKSFALATTDQTAATRLQILVDKIKAVWGPLKDFLAVVWDIAWQKIKDIWNTKVIPWWENTAKPFLAQKLKEGARWAFEQMKMAIAAELDKSNQEAQQKVKDLVNRVVDWFKSLPGKAGAALATLASKISQKVQDAATKAKAKAKELVDGVVTWLKGLPGKAATAVSTLWSKMVGKFTTAVTNAKAKAKALVDGFITKLKELPGKAATEAGKVKDRIKAKFDGAKDWLVSAGKSIIDGLASGIRSAISGAVTAAADAAKRALNAAKAAIGISSPSKAFAEEVGVPAAQGIAVGLRDRFPKEMKDLRKSLPQLRLPEAAMAGAMAGGAGGGGFSPTVNLYMQPGFYSENAAAKRALTKDVFLALEAYRKDYER